MKRWMVHPKEQHVLLDLGGNIKLLSCENETFIEYHSVGMYHR